MPNAPKNAEESVPVKAADMPFETALKRLEAIVASMEAEELPLEQLLGSYQEGTELAKVCQGKLAEAELKIQQIERTPGGEFTLKPLAADKLEAE